MWHNERCVSSIFRVIIWVWCAHGIRASLRQMSHQSSIQCSAPGSDWYFVWAAFRDSPRWIYENRSDVEDQHTLNPAIESAYQKSIPQWTQSRRKSRCYLGDPQSYIRVDPLFHGSSRRDEEAQLRTRLVNTFNWWSGNGCCFRTRWFYFIDNFKAVHGRSLSRQNMIMKSNDRWETEGINPDLEVPKKIAKSPLSYESHLY